MYKVKKRVPEQTTPMLVLEDHELRLRYIENYINDGGDISLLKKRGFGFSAPKKRTPDQLTPMLVLEDHELRLRNIESYIKDGHISIPQYDSEDDIEDFIDDVKDIRPYASVAATPPPPPPQPIQKPKYTLDIKPQVKKDVELISSVKSDDHHKKSDEHYKKSEDFKKSDDFKNEITFILSRIGDLLNQMR